VVPDTVGQVVALDGKAALHMVSAWACGSGLVLGQLAVDDKSNEITALPALLRLLDLDGATVTIDARGQPDRHRRADRGTGAACALALKDLFRLLHASTPFWSRRPVRRHDDSRDGDHPRSGMRQCARRPYRVVPLALIAPGSPGRALDGAGRG